MTLDDVTVVDVSQSAAAPYASQLLAEQGAEVIMVEPPSGGGQRRLSKGAFFPNLGRGKKSITVDLKAPESDHILAELLETADVFVHNYRVDSIERLGYDYESVREVNEQIVYCSVTGYGDSGPYRNRPSLDPLAQAASGLMSVTGEPDRKPSRIGASIVDLATGSLAAYAIVSALRHRDRTGEGQKVEASLLDTAAAYMGFWFTNYSRTGDVPTRLGHSFEAYAPVGAFTTEDGLVYLSVPYQPIWERFCTALDRESWIDDPRFATDDDRTEHREELYARIDEAFAEYATDDLVDVLLDADVPVSPVNDVAEASTDPHIRARETLQEVTDETGESVTVGTNPVKFETVDETPCELVAPGANTAEVLQSLGLTADDIEALAADDVVTLADADDPHADSDDDRDA